MKREITIGRIKNYYPTKTAKVTLELELKETHKGTRLSICGNVWNSMLTDIISCGQNTDTIRTAIDNGDLVKLNYSRSTIKRILDTWDHWHLNDMRAGCEHQRECIKVGLRSHKGFNTEYNYLMQFDGFKECPDCGYAYGSAWLHEPLPDDVKQFITGLITDA